MELGPCEWLELQFGVSFAKNGIKAWEEWLYCLNYFKWKRVDASSSKIAFLSGSHVLQKPEDKLEDLL